MDPVPSGPHAALWTPSSPSAPFLYIPGPLKPVRVNLDDWPGWHLDRAPWPGAPSPLPPPTRFRPLPLARVPSQRGARPFVRRAPLPRGPAVVWVGSPWIVHVPPPPAPTPGTPEGDLHLLLSASASPAERLAALDRTVSRVPWYPRRPAVRHALASRVSAASPSVDDTMRHELRAAIYLVLAERARPQRHRFGRSWATGPDGRAAALLPERLPPPFFWRWFCDEVRKAAEASLVGDPYPCETRHPDSVPTDLDTLPSRDEAPDPLDLILRHERAREAAGAWHTALHLATPRQSARLDALSSLARTPNGEPSDLARAAALAGMAPSTARVQWKRLVDRLRAERPITL